MSAPQYEPQEPHAPIDPSTPNRSGPRTETAKRRVRQNARVHGLTATLPDGAEDAAKMKEFADVWVKQLGPSTDAESALIQASAVAHARLERCRKAEAAALKTVGQDAIDRWEKRKRHAIRKIAQRLASDPGNTVGDLEQSSFGCEWMMRHWLKIDLKLEQGIAISVDDQMMAMRLLGYHPILPGPEAAMALREFYCLVRLCSGYPAENLPNLPGDPIAARSRLRRRIGEEFDRLEALRLELWETRDGVEAEAIAQIGTIETTREGQLRQRYRREAFSEMTRGINQVMRIRVERSRDQDREWFQAHPEFSPKRRTGVTRSNAGFPNHEPNYAPNPFVPGTVDAFEPVPPPASDSASNAHSAPNPPSPAAFPAPSEASRSADSRNNPPASASKPDESRLNPDSAKEMRQSSPAEPSGSSPRTEPQSPGHSRASDTPSAAPMTPTSGRFRAPEDLGRA